MPDLPAPKIITHNGIMVVRDDLLEGGTKVRVIGRLIRDGEEFIYASPACGYAQVALAVACRWSGLKATIFTAARKTPHPLTIMAAQSGAKIVMVPTGYLSNCKAKAMAYAREAPGRVLLPWGLESPAIIDGMAAVAASLEIAPAEVWCVSGSGVLSRALQKAWPAARHCVVRVGAEGNAGKAQVFIAPEKFEQPARLPPPFPSCLNYDAKAWRFILQHAAPGALFWNVAR